MKNLKAFSFMIVLLLSTIGLQAQTAAPIVTDPIVTEQPASPGQSPTGAAVETQVGGVLAYLISSGTITVTGPRVAGGSALVSISISPYTGPGNGRTITAVFPLSPDSGNQSDDVTFTIKLRRIGNGLDYTYSRVGRIKRDRTGI